MRPWRRSRSGSTPSPPESGHLQRNGTLSSPPRPHYKGRMTIPCIKSAHPLSFAQSAVQRRPPDYYGRSGQGETLQATPKQFTAHPMESGWPQRNGTISSPAQPHYKGRMTIPCIKSAHPPPSHRVQCSGGLPTPMGEAGRVRPCRLAEAAHRTPHGKRVAAAKRNDLLSSTTSLIQQDIDTIYKNKKTAPARNLTNAVAAHTYFVNSRNSSAS
ncbi:hypothetical protein RKD55_003899 [Rossellomorea marisflavi]